MSSEPTIDPREQDPPPPFPEQEQEPPGTEAEMRPRADHGEDTYRGFDRLRDRAAVITGADSGIGRAVALAFPPRGGDGLLPYLEGGRDAQETARLVQDAGRR